MLVGQVGNALLDLVYPPECLLCTLPIASQLHFCNSCQSKIVSNYYRCQRCASPLPSVVPNESCHRCRSEKWRFDDVIALGPYQEELRKAVIDMKKPRSEPLRKAVANLLAVAVRNHHRQLVEKSTTQPILVSVPNYWTHRFLGAADAAGSLAVEVGKKTEWTVAKGAIRRIRNTNKQGMLAWSERRKNVSKAFRPNSASSLKGCHVYLLDDVLTSGATASEVAATLKRAGARRVDVVVAARGKGARENQV